MDKEKFPVMPHNKESAECVLNTFNDMAFKFRYRNEFAAAVNKLYGPSFVIGQDFVKRMYFKCMSCNKDMNNTRSLVEHVRSGAHIKNVDRSHQERITPVIPIYSRKKVPIDYGGHILQKMVDQSQVPILGLHKIEHFSDGKTSYYRCCLCMVHSNCDAMYKHLIGDKHTDKYIKYAIVLKNNDITSSEREQLRHIIYNKENCSGSSIVSIWGKNYFPYYLMSNGYKKSKGCDRFDEPSTSYGAPFDNDKVSKISTSSQTDFPMETYNDMLNKFAFIVNSDKLHNTNLVSPDDLRLTLIVMVFALHWIYYVNESFINENVNVAHHIEQDCLLRGILGHVISKLGENFNSKYPHFQFKLD